MSTPTTFDASAIRNEANNWLQAITEPNTFLSATPTDSQIDEGISFFLAMIVAGTLFSVASGMGQDKDKKIDGTVNALFSLFMGAVFAIAAHLPFVWLGGQATLSATFLAYCYAAGPYIPLMAFAALIFLSGFPPKLRPYASNPLTAQRAVRTATGDPDTDKLNFYLGSALSLVLMLKSGYMFFRSLIFVHGLSGWRIYFAIFICFVIFAIIGPVIQRISYLFTPTERTDSPLNPPIQNDVNRAAEPSTPPPVLSTSTSGSIAQPVGSIGIEGKQ